MTAGERFADAIPDSVFAYVHEHPKTMYVLTVPLVVFCTYNLLRAVRLHAQVERYVAELQRAASEALGG